jgi:hypothetical protein
MDRRIRRTYFIMATKNNQHVFRLALLLGLFSTLGGWLSHPFCFRLGFYMWLFSPYMSYVILPDSLTNEIEAPAKQAPKLTYSFGNKNSK